MSAFVCQGCGFDVSGAPQSPCESYDRIEIPEIQPDVTRVTLQGGVCPCCAKRFKARPPEGLEPGSPFGPNLRAFVVYLRAVQGIPLARLSDGNRGRFPRALSLERGRRGLAGAELGVRRLRGGRRDSGRTRP